MDYRYYEQIRGIVTKANEVEEKLDVLEEWESVVKDEDTLAELKEKIDLLYVVYWEVNGTIEYRTKLYYLDKPDVDTIRGIYNTLKELKYRQAFEMALKLANGRYFGCYSGFDWRNKKSLFNGEGIAVWTADGVVHETTDSDDFTAEDTEENCIEFVLDAYATSLRWQKEAKMAM